ncbi:hypothetical protein CLI92_13180 [Vandammella animalimorsus]|uniref:DUF4878 domain-containing protein n=2 Tax=Vandammella animalimorsus TaxID=2029117 RepID=A0A2A2T298_9BURK|nr:DUF4878 domain-containing protein [Vandammella animalimorsus]PAT31318.1 hypothetical protein CK626_10570 [Vandammella animalimorsus]PAX15605.1 hypothetical protein CLI92_13180 [Vandammella animalimorsus]PAX17602.1 hypothetical protein CLI93_13290 [Vandammella animalimorsus]RRD68245.1 DUF4878 domain-containing protein [Comamonadaceae bacterium OH2310_COT-174]
MTLQRGITLMAMLVTACVLIACSGTQSSPEAVAKAFVEAAYKGDADTIVKLVHIPGSAKAGEAELVEGKLRAKAAESKAKAEEQLGGFKSADVISAEISPRDPNLVQVRVRAIFKNSEKQENVRTIKVDGKWKVRL